MKNCADHGQYDAAVCPDCEESAVLEMAQHDALVAEHDSPIIVTGLPGAIPVRQSDVLAGAEEFEYLTMNGPTGPDFIAPYLKGIPTTELVRAEGLCRYNAIELLEQIATHSASIGEEDFSMTTRKSVTLALAAIGNKINVQAPFAHFSPTGDPFWFTTNDMLLAPSARGKGVALAFFRNALGKAIHVEESVGRISVPGFFGGVRETGKNGALLEVPGVIQRAADGVIQMPEFGDIREVLKKEPGAVGYFAEWLAGGKFRYDLLKGSKHVQSYAYLMATCQPGMWEEIADSVTNLGRRFVFSRLPARTPAEEEEYLRAMDRGYPLDATAVAVLGAKIARIRAEFRPESVDVKPIYLWIADRVAEQDAAFSFGSEQAQLYAAVGLGFLMGTTKQMTGNLTLPNPAEHPILEAILNEDAAVRRAFTRTAVEATEDEVESLFRNSGFFGTPDAPLLHTTSEIVAFVSEGLKIKSTTARNVFYGFRPKDGGVVYPGLVGTPEEPGLLEEVNTAVTSAKEMEFAKRTRGRPRKWFAFNWGIGAE